MGQFWETLGLVTVGFGMGRLAVVSIDILKLRRFYIRPWHNFADRQPTKIGSYEIWVGGYADVAYWDGRQFGTASDGPTLNISYFRELPKPGDMP